MSTRIDLDVVVNIVHTVSMAFAIILLNAVFPSDLTSELTASAFTATTYVVIYFLKRVISGYKVLEHRKPIYLPRVQNFNKGFEILNEIISIILAYFIGYVVAYVYAGVTDFLIFTLGFTAGITCRLFIIRYVNLMYKILGEKIVKPIFILAISAIASSVVYGYMLLALVILLMM